MTTTNFPNGVTSWGMPVLNGNLPVSGNVYFVDNVSGNGGANGNSGAYDSPLLTVTGAISLAVSGRGDVIVVKPGYTGTLAVGLTVDKANLTIIGLGGYSTRPTYTHSLTTSAVNITAADVTFKNFNLVGGVSNVVAGITTTAKGTVIDQCYFTNGGANLDFLTCIKALNTTNNTNDGLSVTNCSWITSDADDLEMIEINANLAGFTAFDNFMVSAGTASPFVLVASGKILTGAFIARNQIQNLMTAGQMFFNNDGTTNTGLLVNNLCAERDVTTTQDPGYTGAGFGLFGNQTTSTNNLQGFPNPAIDVNS